MNCAVHTETPAVAYCRTCGKALCAACKRDVRGVIYCENCLAQRLQDVMPPAGAPAPGVGAGAAPKISQAGDRVPSPGLAAVLGFIPGVGAMYNGQFVKGVVHVLVFACLIWASDNASGIFGVLIPFLIFYMVFDAYKVARARELGEPLPDPFGLERMFVGSTLPSGAMPAFGAASGQTGGGPALSGAPELRRSAPTGAIVLIALGALFLLGNLGLFGFGMLHRLLIPLLLIGLGVWIFVRRFGMAGEPATGCCCANCRAHGLMGPAILVTLGGLWLLATLHGPNFGHTWPVLLLVIGLIKVLQSNASSAGHLPPPPAAPAGGAQTPPSAPPAEGEVSGEVGHV